MLRTRLNRFMARLVPVKPVRLAAPRPLASFTFDDFPKSAWTMGGPLLARHGVKGTYYTAGNFCGRTVDGMVFYDADDLRALAAEGHEIACHGYGHQPTPTLSRDDMERDAARNAQFLAPFLNGPAASYAYPYGAASVAAKRFFSGRFSNVRGVHPGINAGRVDMAQLQAFSIEKRNWNPNFIAAAIARATDKKGWIAFYTHDVSSDPSPYGATPAMLAEVLDRVVAAGIEILPMRDAVKVAMAGR